ncbi:hypothetical protein MOQ_009377 [Trypanosoma cruzi marinkellei]|uniref:DUF676 domain-containing protein n=1 Tax=Trypanosoma cruzi marinkellei TaxID=85056 RepID=K2MML0_TRYCR|nr:hypothetical protein MOQ_009377 [Trypanosoma cruzi marinkellei]
MYFFLCLHSYDEEKGGAFLSFFLYIPLLFFLLFSFFLLLLLGPANRCRAVRRTLIQEARCSLLLMSADGPGDRRHFVLFQHGVWGTSADFDALIRCVFEENKRNCHKTHDEYLREVTLGAFVSALGPNCKTNEAGGRLFAWRGLTCFAPGSNRWKGTNWGTRTCASRTLKEFLPVFGDWLRAVEENEEGGNCPVCFSVVGHSFGGIIVREFLYLLLVAMEGDGLEDGLLDKVQCVREKFVQLNVTFENFITIATPHCGVGQCLRSAMYYGTWFLAMLCAPSLSELLLKDSEAVLSTHLIDRGHLAALRLFRRRTLFANTQKDMLVGFGTSSLLCGDVSDDTVRIMGLETEALPCASAFSEENHEYSTVMHLPRLRERSGNVHPTHTLKDLYHECVGNDREESESEYEDLVAHGSPQSIAEALRQGLDWRLVALRYTGRFPVAHVACLGLVPRVASSPAIVRRVAQEIVQLQ